MARTALPLVALVALVALVCCAFGEHCERRPFRTTFQATPSDGRFELIVPQVEGGKYLPDQQYVVRLVATEPDLHLFTAFMVWPEGQPVSDPRNPRRTVLSEAGEMGVYDKYPTKNSEECVSTIEMTNAAPTDVIEMYWKSPVKGNHCITLHAMVAENEEVWYRDGEGLTIQLCEDDSFLGDLPPRINTECAVCGEAKYELTFEGKWSRNTHPHKFPVNDWKVFYGDLIGASHSTDYYIWRDGNEASEAMQRLAEANDTSLLEQEILARFSENKIRTLIKGKGHGPWNGGMANPAYALVRVSRQHHLVSTAIALRPSPDWFLGVSEFELCQSNNTWLPYKMLNLVPWDAGTDNGISFESPDEKSDPHANVGRVRVGSFDIESPFYNMNYKQLKPFATLTFRLIRTYPGECNEEEVQEGGETKETTAPDAAEAEQPETPSRRTSPPPQNFEDTIESSENSNGERPTMANEDCPLSEWEEWTGCSSSCGSGYRSRSRYHMVNGYEYRYYRPEERQPVGMKKPSEECEDKHKDALLETGSCEGPCLQQPQSERRLAPLAYTSEFASRRIRTIVDGDINAGASEECQLSAWSRWAPCSVSCGEGIRTRVRSIIRHSENGGKDCSKKLLEVRICSLDVCPSS